MNKIISVEITFSNLEKYCCNDLYKVNRFKFYLNNIII